MCTLLEQVPCELIPEINRYIKVYRGLISAPYFSLRGIRVEEKSMISEVSHSAMMCRFSHLNPDGERVPLQIEVNLSCVSGPCQEIRRDLYPESDDRARDIPTGMYRAMCHIDSNNLEEYKLRDILMSILTTSTAWVNENDDQCTSNQVYYPFSFYKQEVIVNTSRGETFTYLKDDPLLPQLIELSIQTVQTLENFPTVSSDCILGELGHISAIISPRLMAQPSAGAWHKNRTYLGGRIHLDVCELICSIYSDPIEGEDVEMEIDECRCRYLLGKRNAPIEWCPFLDPIQVVEDEKR